jgi:hypothetical protein
VPRNKSDSEDANIQSKRSSKSSGKKKEQQTVDLGRLPGQIGSAADFLREHFKEVKGRVTIKGNQIQVEGLKHKDVRLLLHKFLRHKGLDDYRVLSQSGTLEIVPPHVASHPRKQEGTPPSATATMPYFFPGTSAPVAEKKRRKES